MPARPPLYLGLTGNIASGKSEVAHLLETFGATIIDADRLSRRAVEPGTRAYDSIVARWGDRVVSPDGSLNRAAIRHIVFQDSAEREALNAIVHPEVEHLRRHALEEATQRGDRIVIYVVPLLFEAKLEDQFDGVILVDAPEAVRLDRLIRHRALSRVEAQQMIASQIPSEEKRAKADFIVENGGSLEELRTATDRLWIALQHRA